MSEFAWLTPWLAVVLSAAALVKAFLNDRAKKTEARFDRIDEEFRSRDTKISVIVAEHELLKGRVATVENEVQHLPDKDVTHRLELALAAMRSEMTGLNEKMKPISAMAGRIQEAMIDKVMG